MKVNITIDCTPDEARRFLGLPDMEKIQAMMMEEVQRRLHKGLSSEDIQSLYKLWMPLAGSGWTEMQKAFWDRATGGAAEGPKGKGDPGP